MKRFKQYLISEGYEIFGFEKPVPDKNAGISPNLSTVQDNDPILAFNIDVVIKELSEIALGERLPRLNQFNEIIWGQGSGAVKLRFGTKLDIMVERQIMDITGSPLWITKKLFNVRSPLFRGKELRVAKELAKKIKEVNESLPDSSNSDFDGNKFSRLVHAIAAKAEIVCNDPLMYQGITKINDYNMIIKFGVRGQGVQAPGQHRVEQVDINLSFDKSAGVVKAMCYNIESSLARRDWSLQPMDFQFYFSPTQDLDDITQVIGMVMKYY